MTRSHVLQRLSLTGKLLLPALLVGGLCGWLLDAIQAQENMQLIRSHINNMAHAQATEDRSKLDDFLRLQSFAVKIFVQLGVFQSHLEQLEAAGWSDGEEVRPKYHEQQPGWLPDRFLIRNLALSPLILLLDGKYRLHEAFLPEPSHLPNPFFEQEIPAQLMGSAGESLFLRRDDALYLVAVAPIRDQEEMERAFLVFVTPVDENFLFQFQRRSHAKGIIAFIDEGRERVIAVSHPDLVPRNSDTRPLEGRYLVVGKPFFDFGYASDRPIRFATLFDLQEIDNLAREVTRTQRTGRILTAALLLGMIWTILAWISRRLGLFSQQMERYAQERLGVNPTQGDLSPDRLIRVREQFHRLVDETVRARQREQSQQQWIMEVEKMAALGGLVAGVAHEINTPLGIGVTAATFLEEQSHKVLAALREGNLERDDLEAFLLNTEEMSALVLSNLRRAAELVRSFKNVSADQIQGERRIFNVKDYLEAILVSLGPEMKRHKHQVVISCPGDLEVDNFPGAFSQIITNLVMNALQHAFEPGVQGKISIEVEVTQDRQVQLGFRDNGRGMAESVVQRIFEPFFTTTRHRGGTGLGLYIVFNLVTHSLRGVINCRSVPGAGSVFIIRFPCVATGDVGKKAQGELPDGWG